MITISAPGKLMVFGEHAVVYGQPCIVTAIDMRLTVTAEIVPAPGVQFITPGNGNHQFMTEAVDKAQADWPLPPGIKLTVTSSFSGQYGFGSSSAVTVATIAALAALSGVSIEKKELFKKALSVVSAVQGTASGFDVAAAVYGGTLLYQNKGEVLEELSVLDIPLVVGYTGVKADTTTLIAQVARKRALYPEKVEKIFAALGDITRQAKQTLEEKDWPQLGTYMNFQQDYLRDLGVSSEKLEDLIVAAHTAGAYGAKLSGAGGGDCMIALVDSEKREAISHAIREAGGEVMDVALGAKGVTI